MKPANFFTITVFFFSMFCLTPKIANAAADSPTIQICKVATTGAVYPCAVGKGGIRADKKEGDGATPTGRFLIREIFYRPDKLTAREIAIIKKMQDRGFMIRALTPDDGWVDDVHSPVYNQFIKLSDFKNNLPSHENLWRDDDKYDIIAVIGYNDSPIMKGRGSAIFMHIAGQISSGQYTPTLGCVAFSKQDLLKILDTMMPQTYIEIPDKPGMIVFTVKNLTNRG